MTDDEQDGIHTECEDILLQELLEFLERRRGRNQSIRF